MYNAVVTNLNLHKTILKPTKPSKCETCGFIFDDDPEKCPRVCICGRDSNIPFTDFQFCMFGKSALNLAMRTTRFLKRMKKTDRSKLLFPGIASNCDRCGFRHHSLLPCVHGAVDSINTTSSTTSSTITTTPEDISSFRTSKFSGVQWNQKESAFACNLCMDEQQQKNIFLGNFDSEIDAATVYDLAHSMNFGYNEKYLNVWKSKDKKDLEKAVVDTTQWTFCEACESWQVTSSSSSFSSSFRCHDVFRPCNYENHDEAKQEAEYGQDTYESRMLLLRDWIVHRFSKIPSLVERSFAWIALVSRTLSQIEEGCSIEEWRNSTSDLLKSASINHLSHSRPVFLTAPFANTSDRIFTTRKDLCIETEWWTNLLKAANDYLPMLEHLNEYARFLPLLHFTLTPTQHLTFQTP
jgi:hypothetical protein